MRHSYPSLRVDRNYIMITTIYSNFFGVTHYLLIMSCEDEFSKSSSSEEDNELHENENFEEILKRYEKLCRFKFRHVVERIEQSNRQARFLARYTSNSFDEVSQEYHKSIKDKFDKKTEKFLNELTNDIKNEINRRLKISFEQWDGKISTETDSSQHQESFEAIQERLEESIKCVLGDKTKEKEREKMIDKATDDIKTEMKRRQEISLFTWYVNELSTK